MQITIYIRPKYKVLFGRFIVSNLNRRRKSCGRQSGCPYLPKEKFNAPLTVFAKKVLLFSGRHEKYVAKTDRKLFLYRMQLTKISAKQLEY